MGRNRSWRGLVLGVSGWAALCVLATGGAGVAAVLAGVGQQSPAATLRAERLQAEKQLRASMVEASAWEASMGHPSPWQASGSLGSMVDPSWARPPGAPGSGTHVVVAQTSGAQVALSQVTGTQVTGTQMAGAQMTGSQPLPAPSATAKQGYPAQPGTAGRSAQTGRQLALLDSRGNRRPGPSSTPPASAIGQRTGRSPATQPAPAGPDVRRQRAAHPAASETRNQPVPAPVIGALPPGWISALHVVVVDHLERVYYTIEPQNLKGHVPVVILLHGVRMTPAGVVHITHLVGSSGPTVYLVPAGWERSWDAGGCCGPAYFAGVNDVGFVRAALAAVLAATPAADPARVYAVGFSNGGRMAYRLACDMPGAFAGFLAAEAVPVEGCASLHPLNIAIVAQQADPLLSVSAAQAAKYMDGNREPTVAETLARQSALDHCSAVPTVVSEGAAMVRTWACAAGTRLTYVLYPGGTHSWRPATPSTPGTTYFADRLISTASS